MPNLRPIRRGHLITPFGVGALVDFRGDESLITAGLDEWPFANEECPGDWLVMEERLQARLKVSHFRLPPDFREAGGDIQFPNQFIPFIRFPQWHYCPLRGAMEKLSFFGERRRCPCRPGLFCEKIPQTRRPRLIPSRFIAVCPKGHIEDFPFMEWVHRDGDWDNTHKLQRLPGRGTATLAGITVRCSCGKSRSMASSFSFQERTGGALHSIGHDCSGGEPWLGKMGERGHCGEYLRVVQRGASNVYFPKTMSSIYLPLWGEDASSAINSVLNNPKSWNMLVPDLDDGKYIQALRAEIVASVFQVDPEELRKAAQRKLDGEIALGATGIRSEEDFRRQEYEALRTGRGGNTTDLMVEVRDPAPYGQGLASFLNNLGLVKKLRETRVLVGFSRLLPAEESSSTKLPRLSENADLNWLPAMVVHGEGIFFEFNLQGLRNWEMNPGVQKRLSSLNESINRGRPERGLDEMQITAKYVLLHTFAHILIGQLSFDCGYGSASLRERLYCESDSPDQPMQGVLIYTASGDSEGTLGGLVRQGEPNQLRAVVERAIQRARWCSSDPVCIESPGQGSNNSNMAACHGCALLPETSCETGNRFLDRALIVGTPEEPDIGFFSYIA